MYECPYCRTKRTREARHKAEGELRITMYYGECYMRYLYAKGVWKLEAEFCKEDFEKMKTDKEKK